MVHPPCFPAAVRRFIAMRQRGVSNVVMRKLIGKPYVAAKHFAELNCLVTPFGSQTQCDCGRPYAVYGRIKCGYDVMCGECYVKDYPGGRRSQSNRKVIENLKKWQAKISPYADAEAVETGGLVMHIWREPELTEDCWWKSLAA